MNTIDKNKPILVQKLTALWVFLEGGIGGILHLLHLPVTGFVVGSFSIIINVLLAHYTQCNRKVMLQVLGIVLVAKFALSPYAPINAYIAVSFQGLLAIFIFPILGINRATIALYALLTMLENALQKPLVAYLVFGDALLIGLQNIAHKIFNISYLELKIIVTLYFTTYIVLAFLVTQIIHQILHLGALQIIRELPSNLNLEEQISSQNNEIKKVPLRRFLLILFAFSLALIGLLSYFASTQYISIYIAKTLTIILFLQWILPHIWRKLQRTFVQKKQDELDLIQAQLPLIKAKIMTAFHLAKSQKKYPKWKAFLIYTFYLQLFYENKNMDGTDA